MQRQYSDIGELAGEQPHLPGGRPVANLFPWTGVEGGGVCEHSGFW